MTYETKELPKKYDHTATEKKWQEHWFSGDVYAWKNDQSRAETFVIDTPPPTVSGLLHMGHVFSYTQCDFVARYQRMKGKDVFYPMGFDDNGLPTERLVEKTKKIQAHRFIAEHGREAFIEICDDVAEEARADFRALFQSIALSVDWAQEYHTISPDVQKMSQLSFLDLYAKNHVERKIQPMLWDPVDQTAIAQAEVEDKELPSSFNDIIFQVVSSQESGVSNEPAEDWRLTPENYVTIGTTRPELIPACVALFYHPDDARYQHLKGKHAITPLFGVKVPVLEDDAVEMDKGTGIMMCCTFGDEADIEKWRKHDLPARVVLNKYGKVDFSEADWLSPCPALEAMDKKKVSNPDKNHPGARQIILQLLEESGDLLESKPITHAVKCAERSGAALELIPTYQWFVKVLDKKEALKAKAAECVWYPEWMKTRMDQWIDGLNWDWCISRQRYFGVPFPVWYSKRAGEEGKMIIAGADELPVNPLITPPKGYTMDEVEPEPDVMDTWNTSSISPMINSRAINSEYGIDFERHSALYPADIRPQAHEIIRTWAFYTVVKSHLHCDSVPWKQLMISGWCLAEDKTKMSKSKGNVVTPVELIEEQGTDAVRYWAATSRLGQDTAYSTDLLKIGRKLVTKLWNATKFAALHFDKLDAAPPRAADDTAITATLDKWILTRLHRAVEKATAAFEKNEYADALRAAEDFFWNDFCDNYLEMVKARAYDEAGENPEGQKSAVHAIYHSLDGILRLFAPIVPHITEELYAHLFPHAYEQSGSLHARGTWPKAADYPAADDAEAQGKDAVVILEAIRRAKSNQGVSIKYPLNIVTVAESHDAAESDIWNDVKSAGNVEALLWNQRSGADGAMALVSEDERFNLEVVFAETADKGAA